MSNNRVVYFDGLRVLCAYLVILLHVLAMPLLHNMNSRPLVWELVNIIEPLTRIGVTCFFMMSGALLIGRDNSSDIKFVLTKRVWPLITKLFLLSLIFTLVHGFIIKDFDFTIKNFIVAFLGNSTGGRFWFIYAIIGLYLCLPILNTLVTKCDNKILWYIVVIGLLLTNLGYTISSLFKMNFAFSAPMMSGYMAVFVLGYLLANTDINNRNRKIIYVIGVMSVIFGTLITRYLSHSSGELNLSFYDNKSFNVLFSSIAFFVFAKNSKVFASFSTTAIVQKLVPISFSLYLWHPLILDLVKFYLEIGNKRWGINKIVFIFIVVSLLTTIISYLLSKTKYIKKYLT